MICLSRKTVAVVAFLGLSTVGIMPCAFADGYLKGGVNQDTTIKDHSTSLNRHEVKDPNADPFAEKEDQEALDVPQSAFQAEKPVAPPRAQRNPLKATVVDQGQPQYQQPQMSPPMMDGQPDAMRQPPVQPPPPAFDPNDPDSWPDMKLAWDAWHRRVAATIFDRFNFFAKAAFKHSAPLLAGLSYQVTRDGHIINMNMSQKSPNILFNVLVYQSVKSLEGDMSILAFPQGSRRMVVPKYGTFTQNYRGQDGFKYQTNDQETVRAAGGGMAQPGMQQRMPQPMQQMGRPPMQAGMAQPGMVPMGMNPAFR
ncbi:MAG TPA: hypothetical protein V6D22_23405 [Candidatus Obscuribacterales bacterium]